jgi:hypothetical protein
MAQDSNNQVTSYDVNIKYTETQHGKPLKYAKSVVLQVT